MVGRWVSARQTDERGYMVIEMGKRVSPSTMEAVVIDTDLTEAQARLMCEAHNGAQAGTT